jgi:uncharacterized protein (UPF0371 family)
LLKTPFNAQKYFRLQTDAIKERLSKFPGKLYFEIGGKFANDEHAARVLPGFDPKVKVKILKNLHIPLDIIFCINSKDIKEGRVWKNGESYEETILKRLGEFVKLGFPKPLIVINLYEDEPKTKAFEKLLFSKGYIVYKRYFIPDYPNNLDLIASEKGFGKDDYIKTENKLVIVMGAGSLSGKMSTCLGQVYRDTLKELDSGYTKYETFPIWNLPLQHPVNLAYEAATADIGDYNVYDHFYEEAYRKKAVNYNRDVEAFPIIRDILDKIISKENFMRTYKSPTDMGISTAGFCIEDDRAIRSAAIEEIKRRIEEYRALVHVGRGNKESVERCEKLLKKAA